MYGPLTIPKNICYTYMYVCHRRAVFLCLENVLFPAKNPEPATTYRTRTIVTAANGAWTFRKCVFSWTASRSAYTSALACWNPGKLPACNFKDEPSERRNGSLAKRRMLYSILLFYVEIDKKHRPGAFGDPLNVNGGCQCLLNAFNNDFTNPPKNLGSLIV